MITAITLIYNFVSYSTKPTICVYKNWLRIIFNLSEIVLRCQHVDNLILGGGQLLVKLGSTLSVQKAP